MDRAKVHFAGIKSKDIRGHRSSIHSINWSIDGRKLASGHSDGLIKIWTIDNGSVKESLELKAGHSAGVEQVCWHPTEPDILASVSLDKTLRIWDGKTGSCLKKVPIGGECINLCWHPTGSILAVGTKDDTISFWQIKSVRIAAEEDMILLHKQKFPMEVNEFKWHPVHHDRFFLTSGHGCVEIYEFPSLTKLSSYHGHTSSCYTVDFTQDGTRLAVGSGDALISLWDVDEMICYKTVGRLEWPIRTVAFSKDGQLLAAASEDSFIDIAWTETGESIAKLPTGGITSVSALAWNPRRNVLACCGDEPDPRSSRSQPLIKLFL